MDQDANVANVERLTISGSFGSNRRIHTGDPHNFIRGPRFVHFPLTIPDCLREFVSFSARMRAVSPCVTRRVMRWKVGPRARGRARANFRVHPKFEKHVTRVP